MGGRLDGTGSALAAWEDDAVDEAPFAVAAFEAAEEIDLSAPGCAQITAVSAVLSPLSYDRYVPGLLSAEQPRVQARKGGGAGPLGQLASGCRVVENRLGRSCCVWVPLGWGVREGLTR